jgi:hypothetical protein
MPIHRLNFFAANSTKRYPNTPPPSLPVMLDDDRKALAVLIDTDYSFTLPEGLTSEMLNSGHLVAVVAYRDQFNQIHWEYDDGRVPGSIQIVESA